MNQQQHIPETPDQDELALRRWLRYHDRNEQRSEREISMPVRFLVGLGLIAAAVLASLFFASRAHAQTTCTVGGSACTVGGSTSCFCGSKTTGESPLATTLTWNVSR